MKDHAIREYWISREGEDAPLMTVKVWLERLPYIAKDYEPCNQWNIDEQGLYFETLLNKGLGEKKKSSRGGKESKKSSFSWQFTKSPRYPSRPSGIHQIGIFAKKSSTSKLQPADAEIICNLKDKYRKHLVRHDVSPLNGKKYCFNYHPTSHRLRCHQVAQSLLGWS